MFFEQGIHYLRPLVLADIADATEMHESTVGRVTVNKYISLLIEKESDLSLIVEKSKEGGFVNIFDVTVKKVKQGITTVEEAVRILGNIRQV